MTKRRSSASLMRMNRQPRCGGHLNLCRHSRANPSTTLRNDDQALSPRTTSGGRGDTGLDIHSFPFGCSVEWVLSRKSSCWELGGWHARHCHSRRHHRRWDRPSCFHRRRGDRGRSHRGGRWEAGTSSARDRCHGADGYARLGRRAHALRRAGDVGPAARSLMLAWRDNRYVRKLWRGLCPVKKHHRQALMDLMEGVEEIPNPVLTAGLTWEWESFPDLWMLWSAASVPSTSRRRPLICRCACM